MWDLPGLGIEPVSPALAGGFLNTAPPGKPWFLYFGCFVMANSQELFLILWSLCSLPILFYEFSIFYLTEDVIYNLFEFFSAFALFLSLLFSFELFIFFFHVGGRLSRKGLTEQAWIKASTFHRKACLQSWPLAGSYKINSEPLEYSTW